MSVPCPSWRESLPCGYNEQIMDSYQWYQRDSSLRNYVCMSLDYIELSIQLVASVVHNLFMGRTLFFSCIRDSLKNRSFRRLCCYFSVNIAALTVGAIGSIFPLFMTIVVLYPKFEKRIELFKERLRSDAVFKKKISALWFSSQKSLSKIRVNTVLEEYQKAYPSKYFFLEEKQLKAMLGMYLFHFYKDTLIYFSGQSKTQSLLHVEKAYGDGGCAFHTLLGDVQRDGKLYSPFGRAKFCEFLQEKLDKGEPFPPLLEGDGLAFLPDGEELVPVAGVLNDYFRGFAVAEEGFKTSIVKLIYRELRDEWEELEELWKRKNRALSIYQESIKKGKSSFKKVRLAIFQRALRCIEEKKRLLEERFVQHGEVKQAYINHLRKTGSYLLQSEFFAVADYFDKELHLYRPVEGENLNRAIACTKYNKGATGGVVSSWYNGFNHYDRLRVEQL